MTAIRTAPEHESPDASAQAAGPAGRAHPLALALGSAGLLWLAFPPVDRGYLAWGALAPFFLLVRSDRRPPLLYASAWAGGLAFGFLSMSWVGRADFVGMGLMALFLSLWWPLALLIARAGVRRLRMPLAVAAPVAWVALEYARANLLSGFPWYYLAHTQHAALPVIQMCDLAGAWGLSLLIASANACAADAWGYTRSSRGGPLPWKGPVAVGALVGLALIYGAVRLGTSRFGEGPRVALLQSDFPQILGHGARLDVVLRTFDGLLARALRASPPPDLIAWPETSYPVGVVRIDPGLDESAFSARARALDPESSPADWRDRGERGRTDLQGLADVAGVPMVVGTPSFDFHKAGADRYNSAVLFRPGGGETPAYHKQALVPFGEYIPFLRVFPWVLALTPYRDGYVPGLTPGPGPGLLEVGGYRFAPLICFEDTLPNLARGFFRGDLEARPPHALLNLTNDGWFWGTPEPAVHLAISVFRAVECRAPLVRAVNSGVSALIDGDGRLLQSLPAGSTGALVVKVPLDPRGSLYLMAGDWLPRGCLIASGVILALGLRRKKNGP